MKLSFQTDNEQALALVEKTYSPDHPDVAMILEGMTLLYQRTGRTVDAK